MTIDLPAPRPPVDLSLGDAIARRRSERELGRSSISIENLSTLLWSAQGLTGSDGHRTVPSAAAQYPIELMLVANRVDALEPGSYRYCPGQHVLEANSRGDLSERLCLASIDEQAWVREAACVIVVTVDLEAMRDYFQTQPPKGLRGERYGFIETGALTQNLHLVGTALDLPMVLVGGFDDAAVAAALALAPGRQPTALVCIGGRE